MLWSFKRLVIYRAHSHYRFDQFKFRFFGEFSEDKAISRRRYGCSEKEKRNINEKMAQVAQTKRVMRCFGITSLTKHFKLFFFSMCFRRFAHVKTIFIAFSLFWRLHKYGNTLCELYISMLIAQTKMKRHLPMANVRRRLKQTAANMIILCAYCYISWTQKRILISSIFGFTSVQFLLASKRKRTKRYEREITTKNT